jgi:hypothetical protein
MESHSEQHFDKLAKKIYNSAKMETPSLDFTSKVMAKLVGEKVTAYKPLISKWGWLAIIVSIIGLSIYILFTGSGESAFLENVDYSLISDNKYAKAISSITFSKILMYAVGFLGLAWFIQVKMLNQFLEKRLEY